MSASSAVGQSLSRFTACLPKCADICHKRRALFGAWHVDTDRMMSASPYARGLTSDLLKRAESHDGEPAWGAA